MKKLILSLLSVAIIGNISAQEYVKPSEIRGSFSEVVSTIRAHSKFLELNERANKLTQAGPSIAQEYDKEVEPVDQTVIDYLEYIYVYHPREINEEMKDEISCVLNQYYQDVDKALEKYESFFMKKNNESTNTNS